MNEEPMDPVAELAAVMADFDALAAVPGVSDIAWFQVLKALSVLGLLSGVPSLPPEAQAALETAARVVGDALRRGDTEAVRRALDTSPQGWRLKKVELAAALLAAEAGRAPTKGDLLRALEERVPGLAGGLPQSKRGLADLFGEAHLKHLPQDRGNS